MKTSTECQKRKCVYLVDWEDHPGTTGYSMYKGGGNRFCCVRIVAVINQKQLLPCALEVHQLDMFKAVLE